MRPISLDLRERVAAACDEGGETREEVAERFSVSTSFIRKLLRRRRETGSLAAKPHGGGGRPKLGAAEMGTLRDLVSARPDATLEELRGRLRAGPGAAVSVPTVCRALAALGLPRKKSSRPPPSGTGRT